MASPCIISYKGKDYSYEEFATMLHDGLLDKLVENGTVTGVEKTTGVNRVIDALESLKFKNKPGVLYSNPFGVAQAVWNAAITTMQASIKAGVTIAKAIDDFIEEIKSRADEHGPEYDSDKLKQFMQEKLSAPIELEKKEIEAGKRAKSLLNRGYSAATDARLREAIAEQGLEYDIERWDVAKRAASDFINQVGFEGALDAVRKNMIPGGSAAYVWAQLIDTVTSDIESTTDTEAYEQMTKFKAQLMNEFSNKATESGRFSSALQDVYSQYEFTYDADYQIEKFKRNNNGEISKAEEAKFRELSDDIKAIDKEIAKKAEEADLENTQQAIDIIDQSEETKKPSPKEIAKNIANKIRNGKINKPSIFLSSSPGALVWDGAIETVAKTVELSGDVVEAINKGLEYIKRSKWYQDLDAKKKSDAEKAFKSTVKELSKPDREVSVVDGKIMVPHELIKKLVKGGAKDIKTLVEALKFELADEYPDITDRQIRDAVTQYGKTKSVNKDEIETEIRKMKRIGRITSALEDIAVGKRPLRSGQQRDKMDAEERALMKELKRELATLPIDEGASARELKTALDAVKSRLRNQIEDIEREIETGERKAKSEGVQYDAEARSLADQRDDLRKVRDEIFGVPELSDQQKINLAVAALDRAYDKLAERIANNELVAKKAPKVKSPLIDSYRERLNTLKEQMNQLREEAGLPEMQRLARAKMAATKRIDQLETKIKNKDFSKKKIEPVKADKELKDLKDKKMLLQEEYDRIQYENELRNRSKAQKRRDALLEAWGLSRALRATSEFSTVLLQGGKYSITNPKLTLEALKTALSHFGSEKRSIEWERYIKQQDYYPILKASKLAITETDYKATLREEMFISQWANLVWDYAGLPLRLFGSKTWEAWKSANLLKSFERATTGYMNTIRLAEFLRGMEMLEAKGQFFDTDPEAYKKMADVVNTLTGRSSLGKLESVSKELSFGFFSARMWGSQLKLTTPYFLFYVAQKGDKSTPWYKPSIAQKMAVGDFMKWAGTTFAIMISSVALYNRFKDDDDEEMTIEMDPRSSDFLKIKIRNTRIDPWAGHSQLIILQSRLLMSGLDPERAIKKGDGKFYPLGQPYKTQTMGGLIGQYVTNKLSPSTSLLYKMLNSRVKKIDGEMVRVNEFGQPLPFPESIADNMYPIYYETISELYKDQPETVATFLSGAAFFGLGVQTYEDKKRKDK
jgi:hypothetical protein